jgi:hypothetical protein
VRRFAHTTGIPWVDFAKGQRKDGVMHEHLAGFTAEEGVLFIGRAQEKTKLFRTEKRRDTHGDCYPWIVASTGLVNHFYFYCLDPTALLLSQGTYTFASDGPGLVEKTPDVLGRIGRSAPSFGVARPPARAVNLKRLGR